MVHLIQHILGFCSDSHSHINLIDIVAYLQQSNLIQYITKLIKTKLL